MCVVQVKFSTADADVPNVVESVSNELTEDEVADDVSSKTNVFEDGRKDGVSESALVPKNDETTQVLDSVPLVLKNDDRNQVASQVSEKCCSPPCSQEDRVCSVGKRSIGQFLTEPTVLTDNNIASQIGNAINCTFDDIEENLHIILKCEHLLPEKLMLESTGIREKCLRSSIFVRVDKMYASAKKEVKKMGTRLVDELIKEVHKYRIRCVISEFATRRISSEDCEKHLYFHSHGIHVSLMVALTLLCGCGNFRDKDLTELFEMHSSCIDDLHLLQRSVASPVVVRESRPLPVVRESRPLPPHCECESSCECEPTPPLVQLCLFKILENDTLPSDAKVSLREKVYLIFRREIRWWFSQVGDNYLWAENKVKFFSGCSVEADTYETLLDDYFTLLVEDEFKRKMRDDLVGRIIISCRLNTIPTAEIERGLEICSKVMSPLVSAWFTGILFGVIRTPLKHLPFWLDPNEIVTID